RRQDDARRTTKWLVSVFVLAVIFIVGATAAVAYFVVGEARGHHGESFIDGNSPRPDDLAAPLVAGGASLALISGGSLVKVLQLRGDGHVVAENLGGRRVYPDTTNPVERRLLNVV